MTVSTHSNEMPAEQSWQNRWANMKVTLAPYGFLSPAIILFLIFNIFPLLFAAFMSFHLWKPSEGLGAMTFVGWENYYYAITDELIYKSLYNTIFMGVLSGVTMHLIAIPVAYILATYIKRFRNLFTGAFFMPFVTSTVAVALVFTNMYGENFGLFNSLLATFHEMPVIGSLLFFWVDPENPIRWLIDVAFIKPSIAGMQVWKFFGFQVVIYVSGYLTISSEIIEAAEVDGCTGFGKFWHIALPSIRPFIFFCITLNLIGALNMFEEPFVMLGKTGGTDSAGLTISMYMYLVGWVWEDFGTASAMSWFLFAFIGVVTGIYFLLFGKKGLGDS